MGNKLDRDDGFELKPKRINHNEEFKQLLNTSPATLNSKLPAIDETAISNNHS